ncbi:hypothetical protein MKZ38_000771 [Zalerion maritima]|uniref:Glycosyltransferase family 2 protein n=1 Tax=Zalerion maritima TaxID=339359 RepID=A0AAD5RJ51_9PEZI|nr:hypothetical protein MKZ38_000771 [Zalerion maritima]
MSDNVSSKPGGPQLLNPRTDQPTGSARRRELGHLRETVGLGVLVASTIWTIHARDPSDPNFAWFLTLFVLKYSRLLAQIAGYALYKPHAIPQEPCYGARDVTFILPTVDPANPAFGKCVDLILKSGAHSLFIATAGSSNLASIEAFLKDHPLPESGTQIEVFQCSIVSKREQFAAAARHVATKIVATIDDSVAFHHPDFLAGLLAPFEDPSIGLNILGCLYLERHNFEIRSSVWETPFVISGRLCAVRTEILTPEFLSAYTNERFFFGLFPSRGGASGGGLIADDDNHLTRRLVSHNWNIAFQDLGPITRIETSIATDPVKFRKQLLRWVKTTWRSNSCSLLTDRSTWFRYPVATYTVFLWSLVNFSFLWDSAQILLLSSSHRGTFQSVVSLVAFILAMKLVKTGTYFWRHPQDLKFFWAYVLFAWRHGYVKLMALLSFWDASWGSRDLGAAGK